MPRITLQIESSRETGNWAYVVRKDGVRIVATGSYKLAKEVFDEATTEIGG
jgi:hypothetical protein